MINRSSMSYLCQSVSPRPCNHCSECLMLPRRGAVVTVLSPGNNESQQHTLITTSSYLLDTCLGWFTTLQSMAVR